MAAVQIVALKDVIGEQAQLASGAATFALQAGFGQAGFLRADLGNRVGAGFNLIRDGIQKGGALGAGGIAVAFKRFFRGFGGGVDIRRRAQRELMRRPMRGAGWEGRIARDPSAGDQMFSVRGEGHAGLLVVVWIMYPKITDIGDGVCCCCRRIRWLRSPEARRSRPEARIWCG